MDRNAEDRTVNDRAVDDRARNHLWVTVLAGGIGSRFWPASTPARPKPLLPLASERPLLADAVARAHALAGPHRTRVLAARTLVAPFLGAVPSLTPEQFWIEPAARGTGPVLAWAAWKAHELDPDAVLVSLHADHLIDPPEAFDACVREAVHVADATRTLVTIGAVPDRPETGYGWLQPGGTLDGSIGARAVSAFHEKPDAATAARYLADGYLWNTGIFVWRADVFLDEVRRLAPEISGALERLEQGDEEGFFEAATPVAVDVAVLERSTRVACMASTFAWDDVGTWEALARTLPADERGNVVAGAGSTVVDGARNVVWSDAGPVVLWGVDDLVAVHAGGITLVCPRDRAADLKQLLAQLPPGAA